MQLGPFEISLRSFLGKRRIQVQHEGIGVGAELGDDERHLVRHQAEMKCTSRDSRSSLATTTEHFPLASVGEGSASCGRRSSASEPLPVSTSTCSATIETLGLGEPGERGALRFKP